MAESREQKLLPVYLAVGEDSLKRQRVLSRLRERLSGEGDLEFNHDVFDGESADGGDIVVACNTLPFASPLRLVEVSHADKINKQGIDILVAYLAAPCQSTVLAFEAEKLAKNTRLYKAIAGVDKKSVIDCAPVKRYELVRNLRAMATGYGFTLTERASEALVELVGENTVRLDAELRKLALAHIGNDPVNEREVSQLVVRTTEAKPWEFVDAFSARDGARCVELLSLLGSTSSFALLTMCVNRLRELACAKSLQLRGESQQLASQLGLPSWRVKNHARWASRFSESELRRAFSTARDCEKLMKSTSDADSVFERWALGIVGSRTR